MPWSGEHARRRGSRVASSEAEAHARGLGPSCEAGTSPRGRHTLERGGGFMVRCLLLKRDEGSPEGSQGWQFDGPLRLFGPWAFLCLGLRPCGA
jgi:hypothetical protein